VAAPTVLKDLDITTQQYSWILGAFQFAIMPADFDWFEYREREFVSDVLRLEIS
jgi:hypothetical protein